MFGQKFLFGLFQFFIIINFLTKYQVNSKIINIVDKCIEEESERLLLKRKEMVINLLVIFKDDDDIGEKTNNLAKSICEYIIPLEVKQLHTENEEEDPEMTDDPFDYENYNRLEMLRRTLESPDDADGMNNNVLPNILTDETQEVQDDGIINDDNIKVNISNISKDEVSNLPIEEEILHSEKKCDELGSKITKSDIKRIVTSFMKTVPLKVLLHQKLKARKKNLKEQFLKQKQFKQQFLEPIQMAQQIPMKQQMQDAAVPRYLYQQGVRRFG